MKYAIGVSFNAARIETCLMDSKGEILDSIRILTGAQHGKGKVLSNICSSIDTIRKRNEYPIMGIGVGIPGFCNKEGKIVLMPHVPIAGFNLKNFLEKRYSCRIQIDNDANCFALGEHFFGAGRKAKVLVGVILGTGIGCGIVIDGKIFSGAGGGAGEIGHNLYDMSAGSLEVSANDFESNISGPGIVKSYVQHGGSNKLHHPNNVFELRDNVAKEVIAEEYRKLGIMLGEVINILNPDRIVVGGPLSKVINIKRLRKEISNYAISFSAKNVKVLPSNAEDIAGMIGAASLVLDN